MAVTEIRPGVPEHTVRARLSEMSRTGDLEERLSAFGHGFYGLYDDNLDLCSVVYHPDRGPWGNARYRGNCSGWLVKDLILRLGARSVFDPSEGGGTVRDVVAGINQFCGMDIEYEGRDLRSGWDLLSDDLPAQSHDLVWYHPPYWDVIRYSDDPRDLSSCATLPDYEAKLNRCCERLMDALRPGGVLAVLIGDKRKHGSYYCLMRTLLMNDRLGQLKSVIIKVQHNCASDRKRYPSKEPFLIPIKHEYCLLFQKPGLM